MTSQLWNGPICQICGMGYLGTHTCDPLVLRAQAERLIDIAEGLERPKSDEPTSDFMRENWTHPAEVLDLMEDAWDDGAASGVGEFNPYRKNAPQEEDGESDGLD